MALVPHQYTLLLGHIIVVAFLDTLNPLTYSLYKFKLFRFICLGII